MQHPQDLIRVPPGKAAKVSTFDSHHLIFYKKQVGGRRATTSLSLLVLLLTPLFAVCRCGTGSL